MLTQGREIPKVCVALCERIYKGEAPQFFAYYLEYLILHLPIDRVEPALRFLIASGLTGRTFQQFVEQDCAQSALELFRRVTQGLEREEKTRPILRKDIV